MGRWGILLGLGVLLSGGLEGGGIAQAAEPSRKVAGKDSAWLLARFATETALDMQRALAREMAARRDPVLMPALLRAAGDPDREVRRSGIVGLAAFGPRVADPQRDDAFLLALQDTDPAIVQAAQEALSARLQEGVAPGIDRIQQRLLDASRTASGWQARKAAVELIARLSDAARAGEVDACLQEVARLDAHPEVRRSAVIALGARGVSAARPLLSRLRSTDPEEPVRLAAEQALGRIGGPATDVVVAVLPFSAQAPRLRTFTEGLQDYFTSTLASANVATVVERRQISAALTELRFQDAHIDDGRAVQIGQLLRAGQVVTGSLQISGDEVVCLAKRIDVVTGQVWAAPPTTGALHDLQALQSGCVQRLLATF